MDDKFKKCYMKNFIEELMNNNFKNVYKNESLSKYNWFNLGGPAEILFKPEDSGQLSSFLKFVRGKNQIINVLGAGSNTLIRDAGIEGITIKLSPKFSYLNLLKEDVIEVGAATLDKKLSDFASDHSLSGFEFLSCIPGSVGGGIKMNTGCYDGDISKILISVEVMDLDGNKKEISNDKIKFSYRECDLSHQYIILSAKFKGKKGNKEEIKKKQTEYVARKKETQPTRVKTCGSTFKNPKNKKAWKLIKDSKCDQMYVGEARVSDEHSNFFINSGKGTSSEIEELINKVKNQVFKNTGVNLELEIKIIGNKK
jgi:UDP-N-acetylmuramate dehydrogenase